ncbi:Bud site selection protein 14 [Komagataella phaffii CBS 7435]|uniref:Protein involved in bud-site selection n=2 Tax=Komagataella phaffii TaxID=460519 RepID=C4QXQ3_KOMPG|nr:Protein involved in bud-site selection [Komagataella phaffii GS115]AOA60684.1 GQ67_01987T0 [Komagataella phaffii]CAH2446843.1 Bud site selection protein 14 [Komagataella phaffii CBS 7435]AOA66474.1 GQ68_02002T0 [Komagataella phaffii GS115]CAY68026.1 Protein involved in bud-site selection [Komagataella phaffii GS115]CCA37103.1 Bud site selection protein 14 [Komagataella phaffii CBS 7435]
MEENPISIEPLILGGRPTPLDSELLGWPGHERTFSEESGTSSTIINTNTKGSSSVASEVKNSLSQDLNLGRIYNKAKMRRDENIPSLERAPNESLVADNNSNDNNNDKQDKHTDDDDGSKLLEKLINDTLPSPPSFPPKELLPDRLYSLYNFQGPDSGHITLKKDDAVQLLNDDDGYWWLVRKINIDDPSAKNVGFAPAEILETYTERLARLNCWKNEEAERTNKEIILGSNSTIKETSLLDLTCDEIGASHNLEADTTRKSVKFQNDNLEMADKEKDKETEILSEVYSDSVVPLNIFKNKRLNKHNFLIKDLDSYEIEANQLESDHDQQVDDYNDESIQELDTHLNRIERSDHGLSNIHNLVGPSELILHQPAKITDPDIESIGTFSPDEDEDFSTGSSPQLTARHPLADQNSEDLQSHTSIPVSVKTFDLSSKVLITTPSQLKDDSFSSLPAINDPSSPPEDPTALLITMQKGDSEGSLVKRNSSLNSNVSFEPTPTTSISFVNDKMTTITEQPSTHSLRSLKEPIVLHPTVSAIFDTLLNDMTELERRLANTFHSPTK